MDWAKEKQARELILMQGRVQFGAGPTETQKAKLMSTGRLDQPTRIALKLMKVGSWVALLRGR